MAPPLWNAGLAAASLSCFSVAIGILHKCNGFDEEWGECADLPPCSTCIPVDCQFSSWGDWFSGGGCTGLVFRQRTIEVSNNECGQPCRGSKINAEKRVLGDCLQTSVDCQLSDWGAWTTCEATTDQSYRTRDIIEMPRFGGQACTGETQETRPCGAGPTPVPCELSPWQPWTSCSTTCGEGRHTRMRHILQDARHNGAACEGMTLEERPCIAERCPVEDCILSAWSDWSMCDLERHPQRYRVRKIDQAQKGGGRPCLAPLLETIGCRAPPPSDCEFSEWSSWVACDKTCDGGQTFRTRFLKAMNRDGQCPTSALRETQSCSTAPCTTPPGDCALSEWEEWSACSVRCGKGSMTRKRKVATSAEKGGRGCIAPLEEIAACETPACEVVDCAWSEWYDWTSCTTSCGGGTKRRSRAVASTPKNGGLLCDAVVKSEVLPCNTQKCAYSCIDAEWDTWGDWSHCSATCRSGFKTRRRDIATDPNSCGKPASGVREEYAVCDDLPPCVPDEDCALSDWGRWSYCSSTCLGIQERNRAIQVFASGKGKPCVDQSLKEMQPCNPGVGGSVPELCTEASQDCVLAAWGDWSSCSSSCGGGQREKRRKVLQEAKHGGMPCNGSLVLTLPCSAAPCEPVTPCEDCVWGQWGDWSVCSKCGGQRSRHRQIEQMPNHCGKLCDLETAKEVTSCSSDCEASLFCGWTSWMSFGDCDAGCGAGTTMRNRALGFAKKSDDFIFSGTDKSKCSGTQLDVVNCPNATACRNDCTPVNGAFGPWGDWHAPACIELCEREREIEVVNNECGIPVSGALVETKKCNVACIPSMPCILSEWEEWSQCPDPTGQRYRGRRIDQMPTLKGTPCEGVLNETGSCSHPCPVMPCQLSHWSEWSDCTRSCDSGWQTRNRRIAQHAECGGALCEEHLEELQICGNTSCPTPRKDCTFSDWGSWSGCGVDNQRYRQRKIVELADGGKSCNGHLEESATCEPKIVDCRYSEWTDWDSCEKSCGGGQQQRQRQIHQFSVNGGQACPTELMQTRGCNREPCSIKDCELTAWSDWEGCTATCGEAQQKRHRAVKRYRNPGGLGCRSALSETTPCSNPECPKSDCAWGEWLEWSDCTASCDGGQMIRGRGILSGPVGGGAACVPQDKEETKPCSTRPCHQVTCEDGEWGIWKDWSGCSQTCGGGVSLRQREISRMANECGKPASGDTRQTRFCNVEVPCEAPVDCRFTDWGAWSDCSASCDGIKHRSRRIGQYGRGAGAFCSGSLQETAPCHLSGWGDHVLPECHIDAPLDCKVSQWTAWSSCTASCNGGRQSRSREITQVPQHGGRACEAPLEEMEECGRVSCPGPVAVDCLYGDWDDWGICDKCDGQHRRARKIVQQAAHGGKNCDLFAGEEIGACPRQCHAQTFCVWGQWGQWSSCSARCGEGKRSRRRNLELSSTPAIPLQSQEGVVTKYADLHQRWHRTQSSYHQEVLAAVSCGCLSFLVAFVGLRALSISRSRKQFAISGLPLEHFANESAMANGRGLEGGAMDGKVTSTPSYVPAAPTSAYKHLDTELRPDR